MEFVFIASLFIMSSFFISFFFIVAAPTISRATWIASSPQMEVRFG